MPDNTVSLASLLTEIGNWFIDRLLSRYVRGFCVHFTVKLLVLFQQFSRQLHSFTDCIQQTAPLTAADNFSRFSQQFIFEGVRGNNYRSDVAIDDIKLDNSPCPDSEFDMDSDYMGSGRLRHGSGGGVLCSFCFALSEKTPTNHTEVTSSRLSQSP